MQREDVDLLTPGTQVQVGPKLLGHELFGWADPDILNEYLGTIVTVKRVERSEDNDTWYIYFEEIGTDDPFILQEIDSIVPDQELEESDASLSLLLGL